MTSRGETDTTFFSFFTFNVLTKERPLAMREDEKIDRKLEDKEYLEEVRQPKYEMEIISRVVKKHKGSTEVLLESEGVTDPRTEDAWVKKEKIPKKSNLNKFRKTEDYSIVLKEFVKEKEEEYEKRRYYYQKIEDESLKQLNENECELTNSKYFMDDEGNLYELNKLPATITTDEIQAGLIYKKLNKAVEEAHKNIIKKVENLNISNLSDLQNSASLVAFLNFYERYPNADFQFNQFFSKQFDLFRQLMDKRIGSNEFSDEMEKLIYIVYEIMKIENDNYED